MEDYLTVTEAAVLLGISYPTLIARIRRGKVPSVKRGWAVFVHKNTVDSLLSNKDNNDASPRKDMGKTAR